MYRSLIVSLFAGWLMLGVCPVLAGPVEDAAKVYAEGEALLAKGDFSGAAEAFKTAARTDADTQDYRQQYAMLRRIVRMRQQIETESDLASWLGMAKALRTYYHAHKIYSEALPLDRKVHERRPDANSAAMLAETQLALGMYSETVETLGGLSTQDATPYTRVLLGLALARQGRMDEAKAMARQAGVKKDSGPRVFYQLACLRALIGDSKGALAALVQSFELTPPSQLDRAKADAGASKDFAALADTTGFAEALATHSPIKESSCSGGSSCGNCPKRASCGKAAKEP